MRLPPGPVRLRAFTWLVVIWVTLPVAGHAQTLETQRAIPQGLWQRVETSLRLAAEYRYFPNPPLDSRQPDDNFSAAVTARASTTWNGGGNGVTAHLFGRVDQHDSARSHADIRELFYRHISSRFAWSLGIRQINWGVTESAHLVDIINQQDFVEGLISNAKLGQPLLQLSWFSGYGTTEFFLLPWFRERSFAQADGRPRLLLAVDDDAVRFESSADNRHIDIALRHAASFDALDLGLSWFRGTRREPRLDFGFDNCTAVVVFRSVASLTPPPLAADCDQAGGIVTPPGVLVDEVRVDVANPRFIPFYEQIDQIGIDALVLAGEVRLKLESIYQRSDTQDYVAVAGGFEYSFTRLFASKATLTVLGEYLYDSRGLIDPAIAGAADQLSRGGDIRFTSIAQAVAFRNNLRRQSAAVLQNDVFLGAQFTPNGLRGTRILGGVVFDLDTGAIFSTAEISRRFAARWNISVKGLLFSDIPDTDPLFGFRNDDSLQLTLEFLL